MVRGIAMITQNHRRPGDGAGFGRSLDGACGSGGLCAQSVRLVEEHHLKLAEELMLEVREKLKVSDKTSKDFLNRYERLLMQLTRHELNSHAEFVDDSSFRLNACPFPGAIPLGLYELPRRSGEAHLYRLAHPLAEAVGA